MLALIAVLAFTLLPIPVAALLGRFTHGSFKAWWRS